MLWAATTADVVIIVREKQPWTTFKREPTNVRHLKRRAVPTTRELQRDKSGFAVTTSGEVRKHTEPLQRLVFIPTPAAAAAAAAAEKFSCD